MKAKYKVTLAVIGLMLALTLTISTGYAVYISTNNKSSKHSITIDCFKAYFSNGQNIEMKNIDSVLNEEGQESSPYTLTITNICKEEKELQIRLNILKGTTVNTKGLTLQIQGDIEQETIQYSKLNNLRNENKKVLQSKLLGIVKTKPNQTIRTNVKLWFDEKKALDISTKEVLKASFELVDSASSTSNNFIEKLLIEANSSNQKNSSNFKNIATTEEGIYKTTLDEKDVYYYRGMVSKNYVKLGNLMWRIVSFSDDNTIKLVLENSADTLKYSDYSSTFDDAAFKFEYYHKMVDNNIAKQLDEWYKNQIIKKDLDKYIVKSQYCNDTTFNKNNNIDYFGSYTRIVFDQKPSLTCPHNESKFGGIYERKIGLLTADEVVMAGGSYNTNNTQYYLYNGDNFFTMSPSHYDNSKMYIFIVNNYGAITSTFTNSEFSMRPTITLDGKVYISGKGTLNNPYIIEEQ